MLSNILGLKNKIDTELEDKILKMDLIEMRRYVNGKIDKFKVNEFGLHLVVKKLIKTDKATSKDYIETRDMDSKKKKAFDLIILILQHKQVTVSILESIYIFVQMYADLIKEYDKENKQIYESRIRDSLSTAIERINIKANINKIISIN